MRRDVAAVEQEIIQMPVDILEFEKSVVDVRVVVGNSFFVVNQHKIGVSQIYRLEFQDESFLFFFVFLQFLRPHRDID